MNDKKLKVTDEITVLSLFNGMSFGRMALETLNIPVANYYSSEIDKHAILAAQLLFPDTIQLGDMTKWQDWEFINQDFDLGDVDLLLAGFPCQAWSMAGKQKGDNDPRGALVHDLISIWKQINLCRAAVGKKPVKFMFENVKMKKEFLDYINNLFGVNPICINSALVSAQNRVRYYWTNIAGIEQPVESGITYKSVIEPSDIDLKPATVRKGTPRQINLTGGDKFLCLTVAYYKGINGDGRPALATQSGAFSEMRDKGLCRQLTPRECARLQTVPERHIDTLLNSGISNTQLYKMLGNGWTHDVIVHIFKGLL
jgi:site-specific DNA-cytosine methylase